MVNFNDISEKLNGFWSKFTAGLEGAGGVMDKIVYVLKQIGIWLFRLRKIFMAIPVVWYALKLASYNMENLPEQVGLNLLVNGEFSRMIERSTAVYGCLAVTGACLVLMLFSRRARYPWIISIFTLVLPLLLLVTNVYPQ